MARIRSIKPEFWTSEQVAECSATARLLFIGMWTFCDDGGVHPASAKRLKMEVFPADPFTLDDMDKLITELLNADLIRAFTANGEDYFYVTGWKHQKIEKPSFKHPSPPDRVVVGENSPKPRREVVEDQPPEGNGVESKGKEEEGNARKRAASPKSKLPDDWTLPSDWRAEAEKLRPDLNIDAVAESFKRYWTGPDAKNPHKADWHRTWLNNLDTTQARGLYAAKAAPAEPSKVQRVSEDARLTGEAWKVRKRMTNIAKVSDDDIREMLKRGMVTHDEAKAYGFDPDAELLEIPGFLQRTKGAA